MKIQSIAVVAALSAFAVVADAAPGSDKPAIGPGMTPQSRASAELASGVEIPEIAMTCGSNYSAYVNVTNHGSGPYAGKVVFTVGNSVKTQTFDLAPKETRKMTVMHDKPLNCQGPIGLPKVDVFKGNDKVAGKTLTPKSFSAEKFFPQPPPGQVWVRRMSVAGTCGQAAQGSADLFLTAGPPQTVQADANFGGPPAFKAFTVAPNAGTPVKATSAPVDCQGASGIPAFHAYVELPGQASQALLVDKVSFTPS